MKGNIIIKKEVLKWEEGGRVDIERGVVTNTEDVDKCHMEIHYLISIMYTHTHTHSYERERQTD